MNESPRESMEANKLLSILLDDEADVALFILLR